jgi:hypothetical protein
LQAVGEAYMKRRVMLAAIKMCGEAVLLTIFAGIVIGIIGNLNKWDTSLQYSNALFIAGCLVIIAGISSRLGAGQEWNYFQGLYAESFREMSPSERGSFIVNTSSSLRLVIIGLLSGILLILASVLITKLF